VSVERQVDSIETTPALNERLHPLKERSDQPLWLAPEQPVMNNEKLDPLRDRPFEGSQTGVHSECRSLDLIRPLNLQAIKRLVVDLPNLEIVVKVINQFVASHSVVLVPAIEDRKLCAHTTLPGAQ
jgi:hypothetical protein